MNDEATNQVPPLQGYDAYGADPWLRAAVRRAGVTWIEGAAHDLGRFAGSAEGQAHAVNANRNTPELKPGLVHGDGRFCELKAFEPSAIVLR